MARKHLIGAVAALIGTIIGAGVLGIPHVVAKSGFLIGALHIILLGIAAMLINLYTGEIALRTEGRHQLTAYAEKYLGKWGKHLMLMAMVIGIYGALVAYLIGEGISIGGLFGINSFLAMLIFFTIFSFFIFRGLNVIEGAEVYMNLFRFLAIAVLLVFIFMKFHISNIMQINPGNAFVPYGVVFFALMGTAAVPEVKEMLKQNRKLVRKAVIIGSLMPIAFYLIFSFVFVGAFGTKTGEIATSGIQGAGYLSAFGNIFAIISMAASFLVLGLALKWVYEYDYNLNRNLAFFLTCLVPLALVFIGVSQFSKVLGITGAVAGGLEGILIVLMHRKSSKAGKPEYAVKPIWIVDLLLIALFTGGIIYTFATL